ncbi:exported hypothetical protein [Cupriavidus taiwanensis]|nr:exported hypothetical protein [Cupriavidus taiwanensis]
MGVVNLIVAAVLLALGMSMVAPTTISVPFKLLLFVMLEGWTQLIQGWCCRIGEGRCRRVYTTLVTGW